MRAPARTCARRPRRRGARPRHGRGWAGSRSGCGARRSPRSARAPGARSSGRPHTCPAGTRGRPACSGPQSPAPARWLQPDQARARRRVWPPTRCACRADSNAECESGRLSDHRPAIPRRLIWDARVAQGRTMALHQSRSSASLGGQGPSSAPAPAHSPEAQACQDPVLPRRLRRMHQTFNGSPWHAHACGAAPAIGRCTAWAAFVTRHDLRMRPPAAARLLVAHAGAALGRHRMLGLQAPAVHPLRGAHLRARARPDRRPRRSGALRAGALARAAGARSAGGRAHRSSARGVAHRPRARPHVSGVSRARRVLAA